MNGHKYIYDFIAEAMQTVAQISADWFVTHENLELPPDYYTSLELHMCYCCWAGTKLESLLSYVMTHSLEYYEKLAVTQVCMWLYIFFKGGWGGVIV